MNKPFWKACNWNLISDKALVIFTTSDASVLNDYFGNCKTIDEINNVAEFMYNDLYGDNNI